MPKKALSITLDESNLLWLKGRARMVAGGNLSAAIDRLIDDVRAGTLGAAETPRSVSGTIEVPDEILSSPAAGALHSIFAESFLELSGGREKHVAVPATRPKRKKP